MFIACRGLLCMRITKSIKNALDNEVITRIRIHLKFTLKSLKGGCNIYALNLDHFTALKEPQKMACKEVN